MSRALKLIIDSPDLLSSYVQGLSFIERSRVLDFLRERAVVRINDSGSDVQKSAAEAHRSLGYQQALDDLINFKEKFVLSATATQGTLMPTYGAVERAFKENDLLPEEVDAIRTNTKPKYPGSTTASTINGQTVAVRNIK